MQASLPDDELQKELRLPLLGLQSNPDWRRATEPFESVFDIRTEVSGSGLIEVLVQLDGTEAFAPYTGWDPANLGGLEVCLTDTVAELQIDGVRSGLGYRTRLFEPERETIQTDVVLDTAMLSIVALAYEDDPVPFESLIGSHELVVTLRRVEAQCWLVASVSGDIDRNVFGDVAYFNTAEFPVKKGMMVGTIGETQTHEEVEGSGTVDVSRDEALRMAARMGFISDEEAEETAQEGAPAEENEEPEGEPQGFAAWAQQELRAEEGEEGDNFGLNLIDLKLDVNPQEVVEDGYDDEAAAEFVGSGATAAMFAGTFMLTLSGSAEFSHLDDDGDAWLSISTSTITATVGLSDEGDRIPFELSEGQPLRGRITSGAGGRREAGELADGRLPGALIRALSRALARSVLVCMSDS